LATEQAHRADHDEVVVIDGATPTQDVLSVLLSPNPFF
jgi:hypothetical protein